MKHVLSKILLLSLLFPGFALADIAVLIHGYHSSGNTWRYTGIIHSLSTNGWNDAGVYAPVLGNIGVPGYTLSDTGKHIVTVELPSEAPITVQAHLLNVYLADIVQNFPHQNMHLIAHSAGGIVARLALVNNFLNNEKPLPVLQLITIATPHRGSPMAEIAEKTSDSPVAFFAPVFGLDEINRAEILYSQLGREKENAFLFWLNRQAHPDMAYTSIVRADDSLLTGDIYVPSYSQDMALVPVIGSRSRLFLTPGDHKLKYADGFLLRTLLP